MVGLKKKRKRREQNIKGRSQKVSYGGVGTLEQKTEREWKSLHCPGGKGKTWIMVEWDIVSEKGHLLKKSLCQIDCHHPQLAQFGGADCEWGCEGLFGKREK